MSYTCPIRSEFWVIFGRPEAPQDVRLRPSACPLAGRRPARFFLYFFILIIIQIIFFCGCLPPAQGGPPPPVVNNYGRHMLKQPETG